MNPYLNPLEIPGAEEHDGPLLEVLGAVIPLIAIVSIIGALLYFRGRGSRPRWPMLGGRSEPPEAEARRILAERFARGDLSSEDFMARASVLNWTPGTEVPAPRALRPS